jgi:hypothetical protein
MSLAKWTTVLFCGWVLWVLEPISPHCDYTRCVTDDLQYQWRGTKIYHELSDQVFCEKYIKRMKKEGFSHLHDRRWVETSAMCLPSMLRPAEMSTERHRVKVKIRGTTQ